MLPLLNKITSYISAYISGAPQFRVGVALSRDGIRAVILRQQEGVWQVARVQEMPVPFPLFEGEPPADAVSVLAQLWSALLPEAVGQCVPLHLALPGTAVSLRVFGLDSVPKSEQDRLNLVRWRLGQELAASYELACAYQMVEQAGPGGAVLGIAMDARWLDCLNESCSTAQIVPTAIDAGFSFMFNHFHAQLAACPVCCALICLEQKSWSILVIDVQARIRLARSWRRNPATVSNHSPASDQSPVSNQSAADHEDYRVIALEAEQAIRACNLVGATPIQRILIAGEAADINALARLLDAHMQQPCQLLAMTSGEELNRLRPEHKKFSSTNFSSAHFSTAWAAAFDTR